MTYTDQELIYHYAHDSLSPQQMAAFEARLHRPEFRQQAAAYARAIATLQATWEMQQEAQAPRPSPSPAIRNKKHP